MQKLYIRLFQSSYCISTFFANDNRYDFIVFVAGPNQSENWGLQGDLPQMSFNFNEEFEPAGEFLLCESEIILFLSS